MMTSHFSDHAYLWYHCRGGWYHWNVLLFV